MSAFDQWDLAVLHLALDFLGHHADTELLKARERGNRRKQLSMLVLREQIGTCPHEAAFDGVAMKAATVDPGRLKAAVGAELGHLHKTHALLIAVQFASNHDADFDVSDALAVIRDRVGQSIARLDTAEVRP